MSAARDIGGPIATLGTAEERALARKLANFYLLRLPKSVLREDIHQAALIGLWDGIRKFGANDAGESTPEQRRAYLSTRIRGQIIDELRHQDWLPRRARQEQATHPSVTIVRFDDLGSGDETRNWEELLPSEDPSPEDQCVHKSELSDAVGHLEEVPLNPRHRHILRSHYWRGTKFADIATELGVSEPRVSQQHAQAILTLRAWNSGVLPESTGHNPTTWGGIQIRREARLAIEKKHQGAHDHRDLDRRAGDAAGAPARSGPFPCAVPKRWLGGAPLAAPGRSVPRRAGGRELGGEALPRLCAARPEAVAPGTVADAGGGLAMTEPLAEAAPDSVPSVLPEEGLRLDAELLRYRDWMIGQALVRANGSRAAAARLLGLNRTTLVEILKRSEKPESKADLAEKLPEVDTRLAALAARIPWDRVAKLRADGLSDSRIASKLAFGLDVHRFTVEKALKLPRPLVKCGP